MNPNTFQVATFNVNSVRSRVPVLLEWLNKRRPDVLCLQETKVEDRDFPAGAFAEAGYRSSFFGQKRWNGVALLSLHPLEGVVLGTGAGGPDQEARMIRAVCRGVTILNTYIPQGRAVEDPQFVHKLEWFERVRDLLETTFDPGGPVIWCGDLNHAPDPMDVYDPEALAGSVCFHPEVDRAYRKVLSWGLEDVFRRHCREPKQYSFYDYRIPNAVKRGLGWRLDHILATRILAERSTDCSIDLEPRWMPRPSDHTPVIATFDLGSG
jgi:exodeoxyribonuclease III